PIPNGLWVLHRCDNPPCVNPAHLFLGTTQDNTADKNAKGRGNYPEGERHQRAYVTNETVKELRQLYASGKHKISELARIYGIHRVAMGRIIRGRSYKNIT